jgi:serine/threonine protein kinase
VASEMPSAGKSRVEAGANWIMVSGMPSRVDVPLLPVGTDLASGDGTPGLYQVIRRLGSGGMANVYIVMVNDEAHASRAWVLKVPTQLRYSVRLYREAWWSRRIPGDPIVSGVVGVSWVDHTVFDGIHFPALVMPFMSQGNLYQKILDHKSGRTAARAVEWMRAIARTLSRFPGVHRDLKPENILFVNRNTPVIADFGLALPDNEAEIKAWGDHVGASGTLTYMSPEQWQGLRPDRRSDIYALGVMLSELIHGSLPYTSERDLGERVLRGEIVFPSTGFPEIDEFVTTATRVRPQDRYQGYDEVLVALDAAAAGVSRGQTAQTP